MIIIPAGILGILCYCFWHLICSNFVVQFISSNLGAILFFYQTQYTTMTYKKCKIVTKKFASFFHRGQTNIGFCTTTFSLTSDTHAGEVTLESLQFICFLRYQEGGIYFLKIKNNSN